MMNAATPTPTATSPKGLMSTASYTASVTGVSGSICWSAAYDGTLKANAMAVTTAVMALFMVNNSR
jgi:hypothetical protein